VHDLPGGSGTSGRSSNALKFFDTHQLKVGTSFLLSALVFKELPSVH